MLATEGTWHARTHLHACALTHVTPPPRLPQALETRPPQFSRPAPCALPPPPCVTFVLKSVLSMYTVRVRGTLYDSLLSRPGKVLASTSSKCPSGMLLMVTCVGGHRKGKYRIMLFDNSIHNLNIIC